MTYNLTTPPNMHLVEGARLEGKTPVDIILDYDGSMILLPSDSSEDEIIQSIIEKTDLWAFCAECPEIQKEMSLEGAMQYLFVKNSLDKFHMEG